MASDDDDDMQRAIQLSLQEAGAGVLRTGRTEIIDLTEDDDDVWDGFDNVAEMDYWKATLMWMGQGTPRRAEQS